MVSEGATYVVSGFEQRVYEYLAARGVVEHIEGITIVQRAILEMEVGIQAVRIPPSGIRRH